MVQIKRTNSEPLLVARCLVVSVVSSSAFLCLSYPPRVCRPSCTLLYPHSLFARRSFPTARDTLRCSLRLPSSLLWLLLWLMLKISLSRRLRSLRQVPFTTILRPWLTIVPTVRELCNQLLWWFWSLLCRWYVSVFATSL